MTPNVFVRVGNTDCWDIGLCRDTIRVDGSLRSAERVEFSGAFHRVGAAGSRMPTAEGLYAEIVTGGVTSAVISFGVAVVGQEAIASAGEIGTTAGAVAVGYRGDTGAINSSGTLVQSGLATATLGDRIGLLVNTSSGDVRLQFYLNGIAIGSQEILLDGNVQAVRLMAALYNGRAATLCVDADDLRYMPSGAQAWGAAARVSDVGGYSPYSSRLTTTRSDVVIDGSVVTATSSGVGAIANEASALTDMVYYEAINELDAGSGPMAGLARRDSLTDNYPGSSSLPGSIGFYGNGSVYEGGSARSTGTSWGAVTRCGVLLKRSTNEVWFSVDGTWVEGNPEGGSGASGHVSGDVVPYAAPYVGNRIRLCLLPQEQKYRPTWASAWVSDILPDQHYRSRIASDTEITQELWFQPWGGSRRSGSPIGSIDLHNQDGRYNALSDWSLRDQEIAIYESVDGVIQPMARALVDTVKLDGQRLCRVMSRGVDAKLDLRIDTPVLLFGSVDHAIVQQVDSSSLTYAIGHLPFTSYFVLDEGLFVQSEARVTDGAPVAGFTRTVNPAGKQCAWMAIVCGTPTAGSNRPFSNSDFSAWTGDTPDDWTETSDGSATCNVTPGSGGTGARFILHVVEVNPAILSRGYATLDDITSNANSATWVKITVSAHAGGDLEFLSYQLGGTERWQPVGITGTGDYWVQREPYSDMKIRATPGTGVDITVSSIELHEAKAANNFVSVIPQLLDGIDNDFSSVTTNLVLGYQSDQRPTIREVLDALCKTCLVDYYTDSDNILRHVPWPIDPGVFRGFGDHTPIATLDDRLRCGSLSVTLDGAPALSDAHGYKKNYALHDERDLAGAVTTGARFTLTRPYLINRYTFTSTETGADYDAIPYYAKPFHPLYAHAVGAKETVTLAYEADTDTTASGANDKRLWALHRTYCFQRRFFSADWSRADTRDLKLGDMVTLQSQEVTGLPTDPVMIVAVTRRLLSPTIRLKLWG